MTAVMRKLIARPSQLSALLRIAIDAYAARGALLRARQLLGPGFGLLDLSEFWSTGRKHQNKSRAFVLPASPTYMHAVLEVPFEVRNGSISTDPIGFACRSMSASPRVWTAPSWQGLFHACSIGRCARVFGL